MLQLLIVMMIAGYIWGALSFLKGAKRFYQVDKTLPLALAWPVLLLTSSDFRQNFNRALKP